MNKAERLLRAGTAGVALTSAVLFSSCEESSAQPSNAQPVRENTILKPQSTETPTFTFDTGKIKDIADLAYLKINPKGAEELDPKTYLLDKENKLWSFYPETTNTYDNSYMLIFISSENGQNITRYSLFLRENGEVDVLKKYVGLDETIDGSEIALNNEQIENFYDQLSSVVETGVIPSQD